MADVIAIVERREVAVSQPVYVVQVRPAATIETGGGGGGGGGDPTNLAYNPSTRVLSSSTGDDATLPLVDGTNAGLMAAADKTKLEVADIKAQLVVISLIADPPTSPTEGDRHIVVEPATGDWLGHEGDVATWSGSAWAFTTPDLWWRAYVAGGVYLYSGAGVWEIESAQITDGAVTNPMLATMFTGRIKGRASALNGEVEDLTGAQVRSILNVANGATANDSNAELRDRATHTGEQAISTITGLQGELDGKQVALGFTPEDSAQKGIAGGYASLDGTGKVPAAQLPSFVDDVIEAANFAALPGTGETGKLYVTLDDGKVFRWSGSAYVEVVASPGSTDAVTEGATNLYFTETRVRNTTLSGYAAAGSRVALAAGDNILGAFNKVGKWLGDLGDAAFAAASAAGLAMLTAANAAAQTALLDVFTSGAKGLAPASGGGATNFLRADGTWAEPAGGGGGGAVEEGVTMYRYFTDFMAVSATDMSNQSSGTGASTAIAAWPFGGNPPASGFINGALGTTATGRCAWFSVSAIALHPRVGELLFKTRLSLRTLSDGVTANYAMYIGMIDTPSGTVANGIYFLYNHAVNGGRWEAVCEASSVETVVDTGETAEIASMATFEIRGNAAGTEYTFYIDGVLVATINTGLPAIGTGLGWGIRASRTVGTAATNAWLADYLLLEQALPSRT